MACAKFSMLCRAFFLLAIAGIIIMRSAAAGVSPASGPIYGGTQITITGTGFDPSAFVYVDGNPANDVVYVNSTTLTAVTPEGYTEGPVDVDIQTADDYFTQSAAFTYVSPTITSISPVQGTIAGGTAVTVNGSLFAPEAMLYFDGNPATDVVYIDDSTLTAITPSGTSEGPVSVDLEIFSSYTSFNNGFTYREPVISSVTPASGTIDGGTSITIQGEYFTVDTSVSIDGTPAVDVTIVDSQTITAITPGGSVPGLVPVEVVVGGIGYATADYTYIEPSIASITPQSGPESGGTEVTINGALFSPSSSVEFDYNQASNITFLDSNTLIATTPSGSGIVDVTVSTGSNQAVLSQGFTYTETPPPVIGSLSPQSGDTNGNTQLTITGTGFQSGVTAVLGSTPITNLSVTGSTTITGSSPALSPGSYNLTITNPDGQTSVLANAYSVSQAPPAMVAGDLAPRGNPDGQLNAADLLLLQRIAIGLDTPDSYERLVGDVAPLGTPDGDLNAGDLVVLSRAVMGMITLPPVYDTNAPQISILSPANGSTVTQTNITVMGVLDEPATVAINGQSLGQTASFSLALTLPQGSNVITVTATDASGNIATEVININVDSRAPTGLNISQLTSTQPAAGQVSFYGAAGTVEAGATIQIINSTTGATATADADSAGAFNQIIAGNSGDIIQITLVDSAGNAGESMHFTVGAKVQILSPRQNITSGGSSVLVSGIYTGSNDSGVTVNTQSTCIFGNAFYINDHPIQAGANTLTATLTNPLGETGEHSIQIDGTGSPTLTLSADIDCGIAPLAVTFSIDAPGINIQQIEVDFDNKGIDISTTDINSPLSHTYNTPGVYPVTAWVLDDQGAEYPLYFNIVVQDEATQNDIFQQIWNNFSTALSVGDSSTALLSIGSSSRGYYGPVLEALSEHLAEIAGDLSGIEKIKITDDTAEYAVMTVVDGQVRTFVVTFIKDKDGIWRILSL